jgi:hypothetical protein
MNEGDELLLLDSIDRAFEDREPTWVTLPGIDLEPSDRLRDALDRFDAGPTPAGAAATAWLRDHALSQHQMSRTRLCIADGRICGYYSLCNSTFEISSRKRRQLLQVETTIRTLPASLVTWLAKDRQVGVDGKLLIRHAVATAREAAAVTASVALVVDPFDDATADMWKERFGFRESSGESDRLWIPLAAS